MIKKALIIMIIMVLCIIMITAGTLIFANSTKHSIIGSDSRGYVTKDVYSHFNAPNSKVAIITGIHPREKLSTNASEDAIKSYASSHNVEIIHYSIIVADNPENYYSGRKNGEGLAADYILPNVAKSDYDLIIICHDHKLGYGDGFYIATPLMDDKSIKLAEKVDKNLSGLRYLPSDANPKKKGTSTEIFTKPLASTGHPTFVYEIPEWVGYNEAYNITYSLIDTSYKLV